MLAVPDTIRRELGPDIIDDYANKKIIEIIDDALIAAGNG